MGQRVLEYKVKQTRNTHLPACSQRNLIICIKLSIYSFVFNFTYMYTVL